MLKNFFTRIISQVIRKLIYPELVEIRLAIEKIDATRDPAGLEITENQDSLKKSGVDAQGLLEEIDAKFSANISELRASINKLGLDIDTLLKDIVHREISELKSTAQERDAEQGRKISGIQYNN